MCLATSIPAGDDQPALRVCGIGQRPFIRTAQISSLNLIKSHALRVECFQRLLGELIQPRKPAQTLLLSLRHACAAALAVKCLAEVRIILRNIVADVADTLANRTIRITLSVMSVRIA